MSEPAITRECVAAAEQPWEPRPGRRAAARIRLFRDFVPERLVFSAHPALPFALVTPFVGLLLERWAARPAAGVPASIGLFLLGVLAWTLIEYAMHRFLFHARASGRAWRVLTFVVHGHHHVTPNETSRLAATPAQFGSLALLVAGGWQLALGGAWTIAMAGTMTGYLAYEALHHVAHHGQPRSRIVRAIVRHHLRHHYERPDACWGISSPLWDWIFRTD